MVPNLEIGNQRKILRREASSLGVYGILDFVALMPRISLHFIWATCCRKVTLQYYDAHFGILIQPVLHLPADLS